MAKKKKAEVKPLKLRDVILLAACCADDQESVDIRELQQRESDLRRYGLQVRVQENGWFQYGVFTKKPTEDEAPGGCFTISLNEIEEMQRIVESARAGQPITTKPVRGRKSKIEEPEENGRMIVV
jgi:hypothetical protein